MKKGIEEVINNLKKNNINVIITSKKEIFIVLSELLDKNKTVGTGGSFTLEQLGILDFLRKNYKFYDRYKPNLSKEKKEELYKKTIFCDYFLTSVNAITKDGCLVFGEYLGNKIASLVFSEKRVILIAGTNKIVKNYEESVKRIKDYILPKIIQRLKIIVGKRFKKEEIWRYTLIINKPPKDRVTLILIDEKMGF